jgi:hypothetical protein
MERIMVDQQRSALPGREGLVRSCWMCGIRLSADQMVADGGSACSDLRWYCRDTSACTGRWTSHPVDSGAIRQSTAERPKTRGERVAGKGGARPVPTKDAAPASR